MPQHLHLDENPDAIRLAGDQLGQLIAANARRHHSPLAVPFLDLTIEKNIILEQLNLPLDHQFHDPLPDETVHDLCHRLQTTPTGRWKANLDAIAYIAQHTDLTPVGLSTGSFTVMTQLVADAKASVRQADKASPAIELVEQMLDLALRVNIRVIASQLSVGAKVILICEPAVAQDYLLPVTFERYVLAPHRHINEIVNAAGAELIVHATGELTPEMRHALDAISRKN
jgi:uroporphyrinogen-III decarboxylase